MPSVVMGNAPASRLVKALLLGTVAALLALAYMATAATGSASARDIVISDSSTPLSAGTDGPSFGDTGITIEANSAAATQSGTCASPNISIREGAAPAEVPTFASMQVAIQRAATPAQLRIQAGDSVLFCNIAASGDVTTANTYEPGQSGTDGFAVNLSVTPDNVTFAPFPGQTPVLLANADGSDDYNFFSDTNSQGRDLTLKDLTLRQDDDAVVDGGFIYVENLVSPGTLVLDGIDADGFSVDGDGGVVAAEEVGVIDSAFADENDNDITGEGGAIYADGSVAIDASEFGNTADGFGNLADGRGGAIYAGDSVVVEDAAFEANESGVYGGAIHGGTDAVGIPEVIVEGSEFVDNIAVDYGGAINSAWGEIDVVGAPSLFDGNGASNGGAISGMVVNVDNASLFGEDDLDTPTTSPNAADYGGAIYAYDDDPGTAQVNISGGARLNSNTATAQGGAIYSEGGVAANGSTDTTPEFLNNSAAGDGGAVAVEGDILDVDPGAGTDYQCVTPIEFTGNARFYGNVSGDSGGAIKVFPSATDDANDVLCDIELNDSQFGNATLETANAAAGGDGGAVDADGGNVKTTENTLFLGNGADSRGGAVSVEDDGALTDVGATYGGNFADDGGAIYVDTSQDVSSTGSIFAENGATFDGGAIYAEGFNDLEVAGGTFAENGAGVNGGAVTIDAGADATVETSKLTENVFVDNGADEDGGAVALESGAHSLTENTFSGNGALINGGAVYHAGTTVGPTANPSALEANAFVENEAVGDGGALASNGAGFTGAAPLEVLTLTANAFANNASEDDGGAIFFEPATVGPVKPGILKIVSTDEDEAVFVENAAGDDGGAISGAGNAAVVQVGNLTTTPTLAITQPGAAFADNYAEGNGGAIETATAQTVLIDSLLVENRNGQNAAGTAIADTGADGGAMFIGGGGHTIGASGFVSNRSANDGGAIFSAGTGSLLANPQNGIVANTFALNQAGAATTTAQRSQGGAVRLTGAGQQNALLNTYLSNEVFNGTDNAASEALGGAVSSQNTLTSQRETYSGNSVAATGDGLAAGGAVHITAGALAGGNSTFNQNSSSGPASVAWSEAPVAINLTNATIAGNGSPIAGGSLLQTADGTGGTITLKNSVLSEGLGVSSACEAGTLTNSGGNVLTDTTDCGGNAFVGTGGAPAAKVTAAELDLKPLANNGSDIDGLTVQTMALGLDSVAKASSAVCNDVITRNLDGTTQIDERGLERPTTNCSSGAYQLSTETITLVKLGEGRGTVTSNPAGLDCGPDCSSETAEFALDPSPDGLAPITLTETPQSGSAFVNWGGACALAASDPTCEVTLDGGPQTVTANFRNATRSLTVAKTGNGQGKVTSSPAGIDCGTTCVANLPEGTAVTLTATAEGQSTFDGWSGACASAGTSPTCQVTVNSDTTATANFTQTARARIVKVKQGTIRVPSSRKIKVGRVECVNGNCQVVQATARVTARGRTYTANVNVNRDTFTTGQSRTATVVVPRAAYKRLRSSKSGSVSLVLRAEASLPGSFTETNKNLRNGLRR